MASLVLCPICSRPAAPRPGNRSFPFCSDRCRLIDLSKWLGGEYRIPGPRLGDEESPRGPAADDGDEG